MIGEIDCMGGAPSAKPEDGPTQLQLQAIFERARGLIDYISIGLVHLGNAGRLDVAELGGSGTLVRAGGKFGIVTAAHVIQEFESRRETTLGLAFYESERGRVTVPLGKPIRYVANVHSPHGPDLGLIVLPDRDGASLNASHPFYQLDDPGRQAALRDPEPIENDLWIAAGAVGEWSVGAPLLEGSHTVKMIGGLIVTPTYLRERQVREHDYIDVEIDSSWDPAKTPMSFQGMSGGSLWHVLPSPDGTMIYYFAGVIFYQSELVNGRRTLYCHGRRSLYGPVTDALASA